MSCDFRQDRDDFHDLSLVATCPPSTEDGSSRSSCKFWPKKGVVLSILENQPTSGWNSSVVVIPVSCRRKGGRIAQQVVIVDSSKIIDFRSFYFIFFSLS